MLDDEICKKRDELNKSITENRDYSVIYKLSIELDELIAKFYRGNQKKDRKKLYLVKKWKKLAKNIIIMYNKIEEKVKAVILWKRY